MTYERPNRALHASTVTLSDAGRARLAKLVAEFGIKGAARMIASGAILVEQLASGGGARPTVVARVEADLLRVSP